MSTPLVQFGLGAVALYIINSRLSDLAASLLALRSDIQELSKAIYTRKADSPQA